MDCITRLDDGLADALAQANLDGGGNADAGTEV